MKTKQETGAQIAARLMRSKKPTASLVDLCYSMTAGNRPLRFKAAYVEAARILSK